MRTRRSPRNQMILWRALTPPTPVISPAPAIRRCWDCVSYANHGRARGECVLRGVMVNGRTADRPCWRKRS